MHELSITQSLLEIVTQEVEKNAISKVTAIKLKVGEFTGLEPSCLTFYFEILTKNTQLEGADLRIERVPVRVKCRSCKKVFDLNDEPLNLALVCPACSNIDIEIISGRELFVEEIEGD